MSISLTGSELIGIAIEKERRGIAFYDVMSRSTEDAAARHVFQRLVDMERDHIRIFQGMLGEADKHLTVKKYSAEQAAYLQELADSTVFTDDMITSEMATQATSGIAALELGIAAEKDSILFYYELKEVMPQRAQLMVNKIMAEEKSHLRQLSELKRKLAAL